MDDQAVIESLGQFTEAISVALAYRDHATRLHSDRVSELACALGRLCGVSGFELDILRFSASMHDIGKIGVPDAVLSKPAELSEEEWVLMREHSAIGEHIIQSLDIPGSQDAARIVRHHHEHFDGGGYPDGLAGEDIPFAARIISIADSYDAMAITRRYHLPRTHAEIMAVLDRESHSKHDPQILDAFRSLIETSPHRVA